HTNTAIGAVTRMQDMGIEPFLLASSLIGVMAQRLVRILCDDCKVAVVADEAELALLGLAGNTEDVTIYQPDGCEHCKYTGYRGRTGIYELIEVDDDLRLMIHQGASEQEMLTTARKQYPGIIEDGRRRILAGETSMAEVLRVTTATS
ncbi:MAG: ATPase, T2SS/T4P/T4SS family, partial [Halioglobus sp.]